MCKQLAEAIRKETKTFLWVSIDNVPEKALLAIEMAVIFALCKSLKESTDLTACISVQLNGREFSWNQNIRAIPRENELRDYDPHKIVLLGFIVLRQIIKKFNADYANGWVFSLIFD